MVEKRSDRVEFLKPTDKIDMGLVDLSESGVAILHPNVETKGAWGLVTINELTVKAQIVYCAEIVGAYKIGLHFEEIPADKKLILKGLVNEFSRGTSLNFKVQF
ncbi:MAG: PilZ domain-containing protein [Fibrobacteria bacterium]|nr:PilZ domain-containing protein [Fibrobacteria bacterium]